MKGMKELRINMIGLFGASIGIASLFIPWYQIWLIGGVTPIDILGGIILSSETFILIMSCYLFLAGVIISIISSIGGFISVAGIIIFYSDFVSYSWLIRPYLDVGFYIAIISCLVTFLGLIRPFGPGYNIGTIKMKDRIINIRMSRG